MDTYETKNRELAKIFSQECIAVRMRILNRVITGIYDDALRPHGIKLNQTNILVLLSLIENPNPSDIINKLQMEKSTVSRNLERMRKKDWIDVTRNPDGASQTIKVTPKGKKLLADIYDDWSKTQVKVAKLMGKEGVQAIHMLVERLSSSEIRQE